MRADRGDIEFERGSRTGDSGGLDVKDTLIEAVQRGVEQAFVVLRDMQHEVQLRFASLQRSRHKFRRVEQQGQWSESARKRGEQDRDGESSNSRMKKQRELVGQIALP